MNVATSIYNRAGTGHIWGDPSKGFVRSLCGLTERAKHLDHLGVTATCKRCERAQRIAWCQSLDDRRSMRGVHG